VIKEGAKKKPEERADAPKSAQKGGSCIEKSNTDGGGIGKLVR